MERGYSRGLLRQKIVITIKIGKLQIDVQPNMVNNKQHNVAKQTHALSWETAATQQPVQICYCKVKNTRKR